MTGIIWFAKDISIAVISTLGEMKAGIAIIKKDISVMIIVRTDFMVTTTGINKEDLINVKRLIGSVDSLIIGV